MAKSVIWSAPDTGDCPNWKTRISVPTPPVRMSAPAPPLRVLLLLLPVRVLSRLLPVPLILLLPVKVRFSTLLGKV
ncbi:hypothetical protein FJR37_26380 [Aphanizomenon sp. UHCC 0183]|nr:hypothetical protein [Aphanizomenon sp. UHCC 0183]